MTPNIIDTDVFQSRRLWLATARIRTSVSGEKFTILALAGFRRDDCHTASTKLLAGMH